MNLTVPRYFNKLFLSLICTFLFLPTTLEAQKKGKKNKEIVSEIKDSNEKKKTTEKSINDLVKSSKPIDGLFRVYRDTVTGDLQMLIRQSQLDKEYIHFAQIVDAVTDVGTNRGRYQGTKVFKIEKFYNNIEFVTQNTSFYFDPSNPISKAKNANISDGTMLSVKIEAFDKKDSTYLIKANDLYLKEILKQIKPENKSGSNSFKLGNLDSNKSKVIEIRNYPENTDAVVEYVYSSSNESDSASDALADSRNVSIKVHHCFIAMPNNDYEPRLDDPRVGFFTNEINDQTSTSSAPYRDLINKWNLKKKNPDADISEPLKPITWWLENTTPYELRETIKEGVLQWNKAFEKAGFKDAIVVMQQPDDADWDAGDIRYNVLRWTSSPTPPFGGYGPRLANPRTGEILAADIMLEYSIFKNRLLSDKIYRYNAYDDLMECTSNVEQDVDFCNYSKELQEDILFTKATVVGTDSEESELKRLQRESLLGTVIHEVGHTLGLSHNMKASYLYSPEQLADPNFTNGICLSASIMDYTPLNITKDPTKQGQYDDVTVGPYDIWAIQFGYTPFKDENERKAILNLSTRKEHIFGNDADDMRYSSRGIDPRVMVFDHSNDPIQYAVNRIEIVDSLMTTLQAKFMVEGETYQELYRVYRSLSNEWGNSARVISRYIGGIYVNRSLAGQLEDSQPYTPVSLKDQKRAMNALRDQVFAPNAFKVSNDLYNYLALQRRGMKFRSGPEDPKIHQQILGYQKIALNHLLHPFTLQRIIDSELYGNEYSLSEFMTDLNHAIFKADIYGSVNSFRQNLQLEYTNNLIEILTGKEASKYANNVKSMVLYNLKAIYTMAAPSGNISSKAHKQHMRTLIDNALEEIK